jgi:hypothetical protein
LQSRLEEALASKVHSADGRLITFADIFHASGRSLYVVSLDLASGLPIVFSPWQTPQASVSLAVVASCAIPGAIPGGRVLVADKDNKPKTRYLVDGGAWSNFPLFVLRDAEFRSWMRDQAVVTGDEAERMRSQLAREDASLVIGFSPGAARSTVQTDVVLVADPGIHLDFDLGCSRSSPNVFEFCWSLLLGSRALRIAISLAALLGAWSILHAFPDVSEDLWEQIWGLTGWQFLRPFVAGVVALLAFGAVVFLLVTATVLLLGGAVLADTAVPALRSVLGVSMGVPPWVGRRTEATKMVYLDVGKEVSTLSFSLNETESKQVAQTAYRRTCAALGITPEEEPVVGVAKDRRISPLGAEALLLGVLIVLIAGWMMYSRTRAAFVMAVAALLLGIVYLAAQLIVTRWMGDRFPISVSKLLVGAAVAIVALILVVVGLGLRPAPDSEVRSGKIISVEERPGRASFTYVVAVGSETFEMQSLRRRFVDERVLVSRRDDGTVYFSNAVRNSDVPIFAAFVIAVLIVSISYGAVRRSEHAIAALRQRQGPSTAVTVQQP